MTRDRRQRAALELFFAMQHVQLCCEWLKEQPMAAKLAAMARDLAALKEELER